MEFKIEGILETLLVGSMLSLWLISIGFFLFGHIWNVPIIRKLLDILFSERAIKHKDREVSAAEADFNQQAQARHGEPAGKKGEEKPVNFVFIVLLAILYGLGVIGESYSHRGRQSDDEKTKVDAFQAVAHGQVTAGTAVHSLAQFVADYDACKALERDSKVRSPLCDQMNERVLEFYHNAKNITLQNESYNEELLGLEGRINFIRSFSEITFYLFIELIIVLVIAAFAEGMQVFSPETGPKISAWTHRWCEKVRLDALASWVDKQGRHWVKISAFRCLLLVGASWFLCHVANKACDNCESQFDKRVYGYYLSLLPDPVAREPGAQAQHGEHTDRAGHEESVSVRDVIPRSPYHVFSLPDHDAQLQGPESPKPPADEATTDRIAPPLPSEARSPRDDGASPDRVEQRQLEPSAVQVLGHSSHVLVANHQGGTEPFWLFTLDHDSTGLAAPRIVDASGIRTALQAKHVVIREVRALYAADDAKCKGVQGSDGHESTFIVAAMSVSSELVDAPADKGSRANKGGSPGDEMGPPAPASKGESSANKGGTPDRQSTPQEDQILSFCVDPDDQNLKATDVKVWNIPSPCVTAQLPSACAIVGIAAPNFNEAILLAVQSGGPKPTVAIVKVPMGPKPTKGTIRLDAAQLQDLFASRETIEISDLATGPEDTLYVTTSVELKQPEKKPSDGHGPAKTPETPQVRGALWMLDLHCDEPSAKKGCSAAKPKLLETFVHKSEGVSRFDDGSLLVVFDDEGWRKSREWAPRTFALSQNESVFAVVPAPELTPVEP